MFINSFFNLFKKQDKQEKPQTYTLEKSNNLQDETQLKHLESIKEKIKRNDLDGVINKLEELASNGIYEAAYLLGHLYEEGKGAERDLIKSREFYELAANNGEVNSLYRLGYFYATGKCGERDYDKALTYFSKASEKGHPKASYNLGIMYELGLGTIRDMQKAESYYNRACEAGITEAFIRLANIQLQRGNPTHAKQLLDEAIKKDRGKAFLNLAKLSANKGDNYKKQSLDNLLHALKSGEYDAGIYLIKFLVENAEHEKAFNLCLELHNKGILEATHNLATFYYHGIGTQQDREKAIELYKSAAEKGLAVSCYTYGVLKYTGKDIEANYEEAYSWVLKAANMGYYTACFLLAIFLTKGIGCKMDEAKADEWFKKGLKLLKPNEEVPIQVDKSLLKN